MPYKKQAEQVNNTVRASGNNSTLLLVIPLDSDPMTGISLGETVQEVYYVRANFNTKDIASGLISDGMSKVVISAIDKNGNQIEDLHKIIKNSKLVVRLDGSDEELGVSYSQVTMPDNKTTIVARLFIGA